MTCFQDKCIKKRKKNKMFNLNLVQITGVVSDVPEFRVLGSGLQMTKFSIMVAADKKTDDGWQKSNSFFDVTAWNKLALFVRDHISKGMAVYIVGKLRHEQWKDKESGKLMSKVSISASDVQVNQSQNQDNEETRGPAPTSLDHIFPVKNRVMSSSSQANVQNQPVVIPTATIGFEPPLNGEPPF